MTDVNQLLTEHLNVWTSAILKKSGAGRGNSAGFDLYGIKKLRELILELALRGKLVPQNEFGDSQRAQISDALSKGILALVDEGKLRSAPKGKTSLVRSSRKDTPNWYEATGLVLFPTRSGNSKLIKGKQHSEPAPELYPGFSASGQDVWLDSWEWEGNAIILSAVGARCGKAFPATGKWSAIANTHIVWVLSEVIDPRYALLLLNNEDFWVRSGGAQPFIKTKQTLEEPIQFPSLTEQHRIVAKVDELMELCDELERQTEDSLKAHQTLVEVCLSALSGSQAPEEIAYNFSRIEANFDTLFTTEGSVNKLIETAVNLAVQGKLETQDPSDENFSYYLDKIGAEKESLASLPGARKKKAIPELDKEKAPFEIPESWQWMRLDDVVDISGGITKGRKLAGRETIQFPYLRVANVQRGYLVLDEIKEIELPAEEIDKYQLLDGDLLITEGGDWDKVGRTAIWRCELDVMGHQNHVFRARKLIPEQLEEWFELYLNCSFARNYFAGASKQTTNLASINMTQLRSCMVPMPPFEEQERIISRVKAFKELATSLQSQINSAETQRIVIADVFASQVH